CAESVIAAAGAGYW
nr:immunoglobulin heavy chain junction region [Macaca mulatta]